MEVFYMTSNYSKKITNTSIFQTPAKTNHQKPYRKIAKEEKTM
jgi:hypothetical protein